MALSLEEKRARKRERQKEYAARIRALAAAGDPAAAALVEGWKASTRSAKRRPTQEARDDYNAKRRAKFKAMREAAEAGDAEAAAWVAAKSASTVGWQRRARRGELGEESRRRIQARDAAYLQRMIANGWKRKSRKAASVKEVVSLQARLMGVPLYAAISRAVPAGYPAHSRDDIISATVLAILEDPSLCPAEEAKRQVSAYWRGRPEFRMVSFDAPRFEDGSRTLHDTFAAPEPYQEDEAA